MSAKSSQKYAPFMWLLLGIFVLRVTGQILVACGVAPFLPPMEEWQSGLLPYPVLVAAQLGIVAVYAKACLDFSRGRGFFVLPNFWLGKPLRIFGLIYFISMPVRYAVYMALVPEARWFTGTIPIFLHMVLALFLVTVSQFQRPFLLSKPQRIS